MLLQIWLLFFCPCRGEILARTPRRAVCAVLQVHVVKVEQWCRKAGREREQHSGEMLSVTKLSLTSGKKEEAIWKVAARGQQKTSFLPS